MSATTSLSLSRQIKLNNGISMPRVHLGVYMTSGRETVAAVRWALEAGYRAVDSAQWYANEREVGSAIQAFLKSSENAKGLERGDIWFTTKLKTNTGYDATRSAIKKSIKETGLEYLDLYLLHSPYGGRKRRLECWAAVEDAISAGEVKSAGVSNYGVKHVSISQLTRWYQLTPNSLKNFSMRTQGSFQQSTRSRSTLSTPAPISHPFVKRRV